MKYFIQVRLNDGKAEDPGFEVEVSDVSELVPDFCENIVNDYDVPFGVGSELVFRRVQ